MSTRDIRRSSVRLVCIGLVVVIGHGWLRVLPAEATDWLLYTVTNANELTTIDVSSATFCDRNLGVTRDAGFGPIRRVRALAYDQARDITYGMTGEGELVAINRSNAATTLLYTLPPVAQAFWSGLAFDETAQTLYTANASGGREVARIVLTANGFGVSSHSFVGSTGVRQIVGFDFYPVSAPATPPTFDGTHPTTGVLYAANRTNDNLATVDPNDGTVSLSFGSVVMGVNNVEEIAFHPGTGRLYALHSHSHRAVLSIYDFAARSATQLVILPFGILGPGSFGNYVWGGLTFAPGSTDADGDGVSDACDNCPQDANPDQVNSDCSDPNARCTCGTAICNSSDTGCRCGDVCDPCPAFDDHSECDASQTQSKTIGAGGDSLTTPDGCIALTIPAGALAADTSISISSTTNDVPPNAAEDDFLLGAQAGGVAQVIALRPEGLRLLAPVALQMCWPNRDDDQYVDLGRCVGTGNNGETCDDPGDCPGSPNCNGGGNLEEVDLVVKRNSSKFSQEGFVNGADPFECSAHAPGGPCETATADCNDNPGTGQASVARCCDQTTDRWVLQTCTFSEIVIGDRAAKLAPGRGSVGTDCLAEWAVNAPFNAPYFDTKGFPGVVQRCQDGDTTCDADGQANGACVFEVGVCLNVDDFRLVKKGLPACTPADVVGIDVRPRLSSSNPVDLANGQALRAALRELGPGTIGSHGDAVLFAPPIVADLCTSPLTPIAVPLAGANGTKTGKRALKIATTTSPLPGATKGRRDTDTLKLVCLPAPS